MPQNLHIDAFQKTSKSNILPIDITLPLTLFNINLGDLMLNYTPSSQRINHCLLRANLDLLANNLQVSESLSIVETAEL